MILIIANRSELLSLCLWLTTTIMILAEDSEGTCRVAQFYSALQRTHNMARLPTQNTLQTVSQEIWDTFTPAAIDNETLEWSHLKWCPPIWNPSKAVVTTSIVSTLKHGHECQQTKGWGGTVMLINTHQ